MGCNTLEVEVAGMGYTDGACCGDKVKDMVRFLRERRRGKLRRIEGVRSTRQACGRSCPQKEERKEREGGVWYEGRGMRLESRPDAGKGATHNAQRWRALHDAAATRKWGATDPDTGGVCRARSEMTRHA